MLGQVAPQDVEIVHAETFAEAQRSLTEDPPDAAIFILTPWQLEWSDLIGLCAAEGASIPYLCTSAIDDPARDGLELPCPAGAYFPRSLPVRELQGRVEELVREARARNRSPHIPTT